MKKSFLIISFLIFSFCSSQDMSTDYIATDSQENWCLGKANLIKTYVINGKYISGTPEDIKSEVGESYSYFRTALNILEARIDESNEEYFNIYNLFLDGENIDDHMRNFVNVLNYIQGDGEEYEYASQLCKIWEEMSY